jgi:hypothetical protein
MILKHLIQQGTKFSDVIQKLATIEYKTNPENLILKFDGITINPVCFHSSSTYYHIIIINYYALIIIIIMQNKR